MIEHFVTQSYIKSVRQMFPPLEQELNHENLTSLALVLMLIPLITQKQERLVTSRLQKRCKLMPAARF